MLFNKKYNVTIKNRNITLEAKSGTNLYKLLKENNIPISSLCDGNGQCGKCKVRISSPGGGEINKPTKKDRLILALMNLESGYRLACEYTIRSDIIVDTEEWNIFSGKDPDIVGVKKKNKEAAKEEMPHEEQKPAEESASGEGFETEKYPESQSQSGSQTDYESDIAEDEEEKASVGEEEEQTYGVRDGLLLIQYPGGVKYYVYAAGINNIASEGLVKISEPLTDIIDNNILSDFIHDNIDIPDLDRVIIILDKEYFNGELFFKLVNYHSFEIGTLKCEVLQPYNDPKNLLTFLRLLNSVNGQNLQIALDNLRFSYFLKDGIFYFLNSAYVSDTINIDRLLTTGKNPVIDIADDLTHVTMKDDLKEPDSIALPVLLKTIKILMRIGAVDNNFVLKDRNELVDDLKLEHLVKFSKRNEGNMFYIYRKKDVEIFLSQQMLDQLRELKIYLMTLTDFVQKELGNIDNIIIQNLTHYDYLVNNLFDLSVLPKYYSKKTKFYSGDPTILASKFFTEQDVRTFIESRINDMREIELYKNEEFNRRYDKMERKLTS
ncbi:MAG: 2Fe-2S iron-sulfur cluster binding domain-containing protein [Flexistipes sinusarabici]|uniref:2Fe-2S iron-sulfur cluster binding domain-containing protein n=1 Tax=Flexistipes sinusarabici TaxID=2352 RepID=A0A5D0MU39_FLESI|nr:2Fe-2S iron-sulfur cluster-binding protein [Flexistipes sinusarabici]TYB35647.1 MAG: 2Fe-2S iron-sulfur cluster binding domain-containing protein [Flexistipes sinusarabici]